MSDGGWYQQLVQTDPDAEEITVIRGGEVVYKEGIAQPQSDNDTVTTIAVSRPTMQRESHRLVETVQKIQDVGIRVESLRVFFLYIKVEPVNIDVPEGEEPKHADRIIRDGKEYVVIMVNEWTNYSYQAIAAEQGLYDATA